MLIQLKNVKKNKNKMNDKEKKELKYSQRDKENHYSLDKTTEAKDYKKKFKKINIQYDQLVSNIPGAVFQFTVKKDEEYTLSYISQGIFELTGITREEFEGSFTNLFDIIYKKDLEGVKDSIKHSIQNLERWKKEFRIIKKNSNEILWLDGRATPKLVDNDEYTWFGVLLDISEKKIAQEELKIVNESLEQKVRERTHLLKERVKEITCLYDISKIVEKAEYNLDQSFKKIVKRIPTAMQYPKITCARIKYKDKQFQSENFQCTDWLISTPIKDSKKIGKMEIYYKEEKPQEFNGPFLEEEIKLLEAIRQIIERYLEREETKKELLKKNYAVNSSKSAMAITNMIGKIEYVNPSFLKMWGYKKKEKVIGDSVIELWEDQIKAKQMIRKILQKGKASGQMKAIRKDGSVFIANVQGNIIYNDKNNQVGITASLIDITERVRAKEQLKESMEELKRSNQELEQFAYVASHDLQEPLRMVSSFTQLLQKRYQDKLDEEANEFIDYAVNGAKRMQNLINDLLTFSRIGTRGKPFELIDMNKILENILQNLSFKIKESNVEINYDVLPTIKVDRSQMSQVFQNLISNAIKFHRDDVPPKIDISFEETDTEWIFSIKDNGIGVDPQFFDKIFVIFQRLHKRGKYDGTGIGLAVCKKIIERHGGGIWVESETREGSTFFFSIPKR